MSHTEGGVNIGAIERLRQGVVANDADRCKHDLKTTPPNVRVVEKHVAFDFVATVDTETALDLGKAPYASTLLQTACRFHGHVACPAKAVKELKDVVVLAWVVVLAANAKD